LSLQPRRLVWVVARHSRVSRLGCPRSAIYRSSRCVHAVHPTASGRKAGRDWFEFEAGSRSGLRPPPIRSSTCSFALSLSSPELRHCSRSSAAWRRSCGTSGAHVRLLSRSPQRRIVGRGVVLSLSRPSRQRRISSGCRSAQWARTTSGAAGRGVSAFPGRSSSSLAGLPTGGTVAPSSATAEEPRWPATSPTPRAR